MFIPTTREEMESLGWDRADVILVSGDTYIDSPYNGSAIIGHWLIENGFKVGMIAQPSLNDDKDIMRLGMPRLFWSVSAGSVDSMVANYTPTGKFRKDDDFTPGGVNDRRPDRACIAYTNLIKRHCKGIPVVLGGIEASLRRVVHYDAWSDSVRRSILVDSKADIITYGMAERSNLMLAQFMRDGRDWHSVKGICYLSNEVPEGYITTPSFEECEADQKAFMRAYKAFYYNCDPLTAKGLAQLHGKRYLIQNPPSPLPDTRFLDRIYGMEFENAVHPYYAEQGYVKAMDTIRNSVTTHRGCYGECNFCAIAVMQGRTVVCRSEDSIVREVERMASSPRFDGIVRDVGGPTANMYGFECAKKLKSGACKDKRCMYPSVCKALVPDHSRQIALLRRISAIKGVKKVFIASGIRYDLILADKAHGEEYLRELISKGHISGQMKIAPEHVSDDVLKMMGKPSSESLLEFKEMFDRVKEEVGKDIYLTYYLIAAHPGCYEHHMKELLDFCHDRLKTLPEQVQIFTPTPSTVSTMMYHVRRDWEDRNNIKAEHSMQMKQRQKEILFSTKTARDVAPGRKGRQYSDDSDRGERSRSGDRDRKPYGERKDFGERKLDDRGDRKSYGEKKEFRERKPDFQDGESEERRPFERRSNDRGDFRERKPYGDRKDFKDRDGGFKERKDFGDRKSYDEKRDFKDRDGGFKERKPYGDRKFDDRGDRKSYGDKKDFGDGKSNDKSSKKPYVKKPKRGFQYKRA
ncbi:MAG: YgiQ family radical SAM protein [Candidatus Methanomethylophilaceae archaeon]|nr:YgiQ family radical SAM protein [Candidatus Methanomethylophilaceae archaeon]